MTPALQKFGDSSWTQDKLERVRKYLVAYSTILSKRSTLTYAYIDAFAGTGYHELDQRELGGKRLFDDFGEQETAGFLDGSATIALKVEPRFHRYIFIEKSPKKAFELEKLKSAFPDRASDIVIKNDDANSYLKQLCKSDWSKRRAVLFIDPFGMQLSWSTLVDVAKTKAIDTWILFPVSAVNRLLKRDGKIPNAWIRRLDEMFGESAWHDAFFPPDDSKRLFNEEETPRSKTADSESIGRYFNAKLSTIFAGVPPNPLTLCNSKNSPLFQLCFAAANPNAKATAVKIAEHILKDSPSSSRRNATPSLPFDDEKTSI